ncbi:hypothetical protein [Bradyrhizobium mercantei]|nr:hypothetical protein [Bradyrhizobium mercantei]
MRFDDGNEAETDLHVSFGQNFIGAKALRDAFVRASKNSHPSEMCFA